MAFYICSKCGFGSASWYGKCPNCGEFNTFEKKQEGEVDSSGQPTQKIKLTSFKKITHQEKLRKSTGIYEFDRVLGGGMVPGEVLLLSGEPGVGKSTLLLQALQKMRTVYVSGEESGEQVKERAKRLDVNLDNFLFSDDLQIEGIVSGLEEMRDQIDIVVVDSIQTIYSKKIDAVAGNVSQLRECANQLTGFAKRNRIAVIVVGHITKGGDIAGPKTLEHIVDCVLSFEGEPVSNYRILRASKNRFGSTDEIGIFEMAEQGLVEVNNPLVFLEQGTNQVAGKAIVGVAEGKRSLFFEIQTLTVPTSLPVPRRVVNGVDYNKVLLLLAVIRKHLSIPLDTYDIYVNVVGGVSIKSTEADLGIIASLLSSIKNAPLSSRQVFVGEVGLLGEVRRHPAEDRIIKEAKRLKFSSIYSSMNTKNIKSIRGLFNS